MPDIDPNLIITLIVSLLGMLGVGVGTTKVSIRRAEQRTAQRYEREISDGNGGKLVVDILSLDADIRQLSRCVLDIKQMHAQQIQYQQQQRQFCEQRFRRIEGSR